FPYTTLFRSIRSRTAGAERETRRPSAWKLRRAFSFSSTSRRKSFSSTHGSMASSFKNSRNRKSRITRGQVRRSIGRVHDVRDIRIDYRVDGAEGTNRRPGNANRRDRIDRSNGEARPGGGTSSRVCPHGLHSEARRTRRHRWPVGGRRGRWTQIR